MAPFPFAPPHLGGHGKNGERPKEEEEEEEGRSEESQVGGRRECTHFYSLPRPSAASSSSSSSVRPLHFRHLRGERLNKRQGEEERLSLGRMGGWAA